MRDDTILRADIYRPSVLGTYPVLLCRTPYDKSNARYVNMASSLARRGYIAVIQDIRGRWKSDGSWSWHLSFEGAAVEQHDGYDSCEWASHLKGSDGQVGTFGNSYPSWLIWQMAAARPPSLKAVFTSGFPVNTLDCTRGVFETGVRLRWHHRMAVSTRKKIGDRAYPQTEIEALHHWDHLTRGKYIWQIPLEDLPDELFGPDTELLHGYWRGINTEYWALHRLHEKVEVPTCTLTGWWDRLSSAVDHFTGMRMRGPARFRDQHRLIIGPWTHDIEATQPPLPRDYGTKALLDLPDLIQRWYDHHLKGIDNGLDEEPPVKFFVLNDNSWHFETNWPPPNVVATNFYLGSEGRANTPVGDGYLTRNLPTETKADHFDYDPRNPVLSLVGPSGQAMACDQSPLLERQDILVYQTKILSEDLVFAGPVSCVLFIESDAPDTDFFAKLIEVGPDNLAINIAQGMLRSKYRSHYGQEEMLSAGEVVELRFELMIVGIKFSAGSRIRLDVTSSDFPTFDRNHNTGRPFYSDDELRVAHQKVWHGSNRSSRLILPLVQAYGMDNSESTAG